MNEFCQTIIENKLPYIVLLGGPFAAGVLFGIVLEKFFQTILDRFR